jgi:hypothetical protein
MKLNEPLNGKTSTQTKGLNWSDFCHHRVSKDYYGMKSHNRVLALREQTCSLILNIQMALLNAGYGMTRHFIR